ncbi:MAG: hypothetical protein ABII22_00820 [Candidatus Micrarchaeota archaeon]
MKRGQSSLESLIMIGFGLIISVAFFSMAFIFITDSIAAQQGKDAANRIGSEIDYVYSSGVGTVRYVDVTFPAGTQSVLVGDHRVVVTVQLSSGTSQYFASTDASLVGMIDSEPGLERVRIEYLDSEKLLVGTASLSMTPKRLDFALQSTGLASSQVNASNEGASLLNGIVSTVDTSISDMVSLSGVPASLASGASSLFNVLVSVPGGKTLGIYSGLVTLTSASGETDSTLVVVNILGQTPTSCSILPSIANVSQGSSQEFTISCLDANSSSVSCPVFTWTTNAGQVIPPTSSTSTTLIVTQTSGTYVLASAGFICSATLVFNGTTLDTQGPIATILSLSPASPQTGNSITVNATGDDTTTGNNNIQSCEAKMDVAGAWNLMTAVDGSYSSPIENVTYTFNPQSKGSHTIYVRCTDSIGNLGNETSIAFNVTKPIKPILFIQDAAGATATETYWKSWISGHTSAQGYNWSYDVSNVADVTGGVTDPTGYKIVVMAEYPNGNALLNSNLTNYKTGGGYVVLLANALQRGPQNLGLTGSTGNQQSRNEMEIITAHNITTGYTVGIQYTIQNSNQNIYYNNNLVTNIGAMETGSTRTMLGENSRILTYGPTRPDIFNADGNTFATRVLDWALAQSTIAG